MDKLIWLQKEELLSQAIPTLEQVEVVLDIGPGDSAPAIYYSAVANIGDSRGLEK
jgi:hypothetical protein